MSYIFMPVIFSTLRKCTRSFVQHSNVVTLLRHYSELDPASSCFDVQMICILIEMHFAEI